ncbi:SpoIID/LytB domain-containing protein [Vampirovibrio chlorellavorus]|uniref:SpoIID/LytB domain-containing protein n=1 Tax=Vampirovibrio chlorellavorus TaxID=758823 RepID=UPI0026EB3BA6|nr:SpoIID/LytB domain-containing protein [Vampirovibrio chlorellavorus]
MILPWRVLLATGWCIALLTGSVEAALPSQVRVRLFEAHPTVQAFRLQGALRIQGGAGSSVPASVLTVGQSQGRLWARCGPRQSLCYRGARLTVQAMGGQPIQVTALHGDRSLPARRYSGPLTFVIQQGRLRVFNTLLARHYVAVVISSETGPGWPLEALKAQAVLTQTRLSRYKPGDVLGDSTQQEVYLGEAYRKPNAEQAVRAVWGQTLTSNGQAIQPYYHASCGGHTSHLRWFAGQAMPSGQVDGVICPYCAKAPFAQTTVSVLNAAQWQSVYPNSIPKKAPLAESMPTVTQVDASGRPLQVQVGAQRLSGYQFWLRLGQRLGWDKLPGTRFQLQALPNGRLRLSSTGAGHGVGLCQWGAAEMARQGQRYNQILKFYFPQARLSGR